MENVRPERPPCKVRASRVGRIRPKRRTEPKKLGSCSVPVIERSNLFQVFRLLGPVNRINRDDRNVSIGIGGPKNPVKKILRSNQPTLAPYSYSATPSPQRCAALLTIALALRVALASCLPGGRLGTMRAASGTCAPLPPSASSPPRRRRHRPPSAGPPAPPPASTAPTSPRHPPRAPWLSPLPWCCHLQYAAEARRPQAPICQARADGASSTPTVMSSAKANLR